jgi:hypothetical protein
MVHILAMTLKMVGVICQTKSKSVSSSSVELCLVCVHWNAKSFALFSGCSIFTRSWSSSSRSCSSRQGSCRGGWRSWSRWRQGSGAVSTTQSTASSSRRRGSRSWRTAWRRRGSSRTASLPGTGLHRQQLELLEQAYRGDSKCRL